MADNETEKPLDKIAKLLAEDTEYPLEGTLFYAEVQMGAAGMSIFKNRGNHILYCSEVFHFFDAVIEVWEEAEPNKRWAEMEYVIRGGKFEVIFTYPEEIDPEEEPFDRRDRIVKKYFGDKPIVYPPWPGDETAQQFDL